jgi:hypothetical protein
MSQLDIVMWLGAVSLVTGAFILAVVYHRMLRPLTNEYWQAKTLVETIVTTFKRRYDELSRIDSAIIVGVETTKRQLQEGANGLSEVNARLGSISHQVESFALSNDATRADLSSLHSELENMRRGLDAPKTIDAPHFAPRVATRTTSPEQPTNEQGHLTDTEQAVLQFLKSEGPKTSRQIETKIEKTREHTARLMKKLWQQGYVEREIHTTPFTYRLANGFQELEAHNA